MLDNLFEQAITSGNNQKIKQITDSLELVIIKAQYFPDEVFDFLVRLLEKEYFLRMEQSRYIFYIFRNNFDLMSENQKEDLIIPLEKAYKNLKDWMAWFTISEILGECYQNEQALKSIIRLKNVSNEHSRSFLAHSLEHIAKSPDTNLAKLALDQLLLLKNDPAARVQYEVNISLERLTHQGYFK